MPNNLSPWFDNEDPVHNGLYERKTTLFDSVWAYWFEGAWYAFTEEPNEAITQAKLGRKSWYPTSTNHPWRGITA